MRFLKWHFSITLALMIHIGSLLVLVLLWTVAVDEYSWMDFRYACYWLIPINIFVIVGDLIYFKVNKL